MLILWCPSSKTSFCHLFSNIGCRLYTCVIAKIGIKSAGQWYILWRIEMNNTWLYRFADCFSWMFSPILICEWASTFDADCFIINIYTYSIYCYFNVFLSCTNFIMRFDTFIVLCLNYVLTYMTIHILIYIKNDIRLINYDFIYKIWAFKIRVRQKWANIKIRPKKG